MSNKDVRLAAVVLLDLAKRLTTVAQEMIERGSFITLSDNLIDIAKELDKVIEAIELRNKYGVDSLTKLRFLE